MTRPETVGLVIAGLGLVVATIASVLGYLALFPQRRELVHGLQSKYRLLDHPAAAGELTVRLGTRLLNEPYIVEYGLTATGRADITSDEFDGAEPFRLVFDQPVVADLTPHGADTLAYAWSVHGPDGNQIALDVGPTLLKRGNRYVFALLLDGDPDALTIAMSHRLRNTRVVDRAVRVHRQRLRRIVACYSAAGAFAVAGVIAGLGPFGTRLAGVVLLAAATAPLFLGLIVANRRG